MKTGLTFLLVISFLCFTADALQCYSCTAVISNTQCNQNIENCTNAEDNCMTTVTHALGIRVITKTCATDVMCSTAAATNVDIGIGGNNATCCMTNLCNMNGCAIAGLHVVLLGLPAVLLLLLSGTS